MMQWFFTCLFIVLSEQIVYIKPPWTLRDVLQCLKKHWVAVFGQVVPRRKLQTVLNLIDFFKSGMYFSCKLSPNVNFIVFNSRHMRIVSPFFSPRKQTLFRSHVQVLLQLKISSNRIPFALIWFDGSYRGSKIIVINEMANRIPLVR